MKIFTDTAAWRCWLADHHASATEVWVVPAKKGTTNITRVARLRQAGRMRPAGLAEVERAKAEGRWDA
ncbi:YdeI/OmpD-associated family protein [Planotetraspora mira]|uniref:Uncharacterized protein n=1 Tax=Planotetraspora mira TaxID=58121 RepID=A0A8J3TZM4_9ACTN|nr:hypothetical protein [Planotetraspora mira]GII34212.1 hypothetical protein Pmi06nite_76540 [Planotetraspora mira]